MKSAKPTQLLHKAKRFSLVHKSLNIDAAHVLGLVVKLAYSFPNPAKPHLTIFSDDDEARSKEWSIYGAPSDAPITRVAHIKFSASKDIQDFQIADAKFRMQFLRKEQRKVTYPDGSSGIEPVYEFVIQPAG